MPVLIALLSKLFVGFITKVVAVLVVYLLYRFFLLKSGVFFDWLLSHLGGIDLSQSTIELVGQASWLAQKLQLQECISLAVSFGVVAFTISVVKSIK